MMNRHSDIKQVQKEVQKEVQISDLDLYIVESIQKGISVRKLFSRLKMKRSSFYYHVEKLKKMGIIEQIGYGTWQICPKFQSFSDKQIAKVLDDKKRSPNQSSLGVRQSKANLHALRINIPILEGKIKLDNGFKIQMNHWTKEVKRMSNLGLTFTNNNNKSLDVNVWSRTIYDALAIPNICHGVVNYVCRNYKEKGVLLDYFNWKVTTLHVMVRSDHIDKIFNKRMKIEVALGRDCVRIGESDVTREAKAWIDKSPYGGIETNDVGYYANLIQMPERMMVIEKKLDYTMQHQDIYNLNIEKHLKTMENINDGIVKMNNTLDKLNDEIRLQRVMRNYETLSKEIQALKKNVG